MMAFYIDIYIIFKFIFICLFFPVVTSYNSKYWYNSDKKEILTEYIINIIEEKEINLHE